MSKQANAVAGGTRSDVEAIVLALTMLLLSIALLLLPVPHAQAGPQPETDPRPQTGARVPGDPDRALDAEFLETLAALDPTAAGWESEAESALLQNGLDRFQEALIHGSASLDLEAGPDLSDWVAENCPQPALAPPGTLPATMESSAGASPEPGATDWPVVFEGDGFRVRRGSPSSGPDAPLDRRPGPLGMSSALALLGRIWNASPEVELKIVGYEAEGEQRRTAVHFHASGATASGWCELIGRWELVWLITAEGPRLVNLDPGEMTEVRRATRLFEERTESLFGADPAFHETVGELQLGFGWSEGVSGLRTRLDTRLGVPLLGSPAGVAVGDVDGDGLEDLYLSQPGGMPNRLLLHTKDHGIEDASLGSGIDFLEISRAALFLDFDADGDLDLVVSVVDELLFLENDGEAIFRLRTAVKAPETTSLAAADFDLDGDLDLYACAYFEPYSGISVPVPYHDARNGLANVLLENQGDWSFVPVTASVGLDVNNDRFSFAASWEDYDGDGDPDLYVANDFGRNNLYRNDGGRFTDVAAAAGVQDLSAGMGVSWGDYDGDGLFDLYVSNMYSAAGNRVAYQRRFQADTEPAVRQAYQRHARGNSLFRNLGDGTFSDVSESAGVSMARWAWGSRFIDMNNDGRLDLLAPNGFLTGEKSDDL